MRLKLRCGIKLVLFISPAILAGNVNEIYNSAIVLEQEGKLQEAITAYQEVVTKYPNDPLAKDHAAYRTPLICPGQNWLQRQLLRPC